MAEGSLFSWLNEEIFRRPTYSRSCCLLDNYNPHQGYKEVVTSEERQEEEAFIEEISRTLPIKYLYKYLLAKGIVSGNYQEFKSKMLSLWFDLCGRGVHLAVLLLLTCFCWRNQTWRARSLWIS
uniref:EndoU domain-containing protein n=1 Tax=Ixodes ricinus TaxID=34613 RepID=A0A0K8RC51_IXORI